MPPLFVARLVNLLKHFYQVYPKVLFAPVELRVLSRHWFSHVIAVLRQVS